MKKTINISIGKQYLFSTLLLFLFISVLYFLQNIIGYETVSLILLLIIFLLPIFSFEKGPIIISAVISALAWDYYFIPPHFTMKIDKAEDVVMLFMFFIVAITNGVLTAKLKSKDKRMIEKDRKLNALYQLVRHLSISNNLDEVLLMAVKQIKNVFGFDSIIFFPGNDGKLKRIPHSASSFEPDEMEWLLAEASYKSKIETGKTTAIQNDADTVYFPIEVNEAVFCVFGIRTKENIDIPQPEIEFLRQYLKEITSFLRKFSVYSKP